MLKNDIHISEYDKTLTEIELWAHVRFLTILGANSEAIHYGELCMKNHIRFEEKDINVLYQLVRAYCNAGKQEEALMLFMNIKNLVHDKNQRGISTFLKGDDMDPHYKIVKRYRYNDYQRRIKRLLWESSFFLLKVIVLFIVTFTLTAAIIHVFFTCFVA